MTTGPQIPAGAHQAPPGVLKSAWLPLANEALRTGHEARVAGVRAKELETACNYTESRMADAAAHLSGPDQEWARTDMQRDRERCTTAQINAGQLIERWARLMDRLLDVEPGLYLPVDEAIWGDTFD